MGTAAGPGAADREGLSPLTSGSAALKGMAVVPKAGPPAGGAGEGCHPRRCGSDGPGRRPSSDVLVPIHRHREPKLRSAPWTNHTRRRGRRGCRRRDGGSTNSWGSDCGGACPGLLAARRAGNDGSGTTLHCDDVRAGVSLCWTRWYLRRKRQDVGPGGLPPGRACLAWRLVQPRARRDTTTVSSSDIGHHLSLSAPAQLLRPHEVDTVRRGPSSHYLLAY